MGTVCFSILLLVLLMKEWLVKSHTYCSYRSDEKEKHGRILSMFRYLPEIYGYWFDLMISYILLKVGKMVL